MGGGAIKRERNIGAPEDYRNVPGEWHDRGASVWEFPTAPVGNAYTNSEIAVGGMELHFVKRLKMNELSDFPGSGTLLAFYVIELR